MTVANKGEGVIMNAKQFTHRLVASALAFGFVALASSLVLGQQSQAPAQQDQQRKERQLLRLTMPEAARVAGHPYVREFNVESWMIAPDLASLTKGSEFVIVGEVTSTRSVLAKSADYIQTVAQVLVIEGIKGNVLPTGAVKVVV